MTPYMKRIRGHLTFANCIAVIALFVALGGSAYAATQLPRGSVGAVQLKKGAVTPAKLAKATKAALTGPEGAAGAAGATGHKGERGEAEPTGPHGVLGTTGAEPLAVDASSSDFEFGSSGSSSNVPLSGRTSWTMGPGQAGLLFGKVVIRAGTSPGPHPPAPPPICAVQVRVFDSGTEVADVTTTALAVEEATLKLTTAVIAFREPGLHTITTTVHASPGLCEAGSKIVSLALGVAPLG
jgi:hypothetical protein